MITLGHPLSSLADPSTVFSFVKRLNDNGGLHCYEDEKGNLIGSLGFSVIPLWWAHNGTKVLVEEFVICCDDTVSGFGRMAISELEALSDKFGCSLIHTGNLLGTTQKQVENLYMRKGNFSLKCNSFLKVMRGDENG